MTKTNQQIITDAFTKLGVVADGKQPAPNLSSAGINILNDNMLTQMRDGWGGIGWYPQGVQNLSSNAPLRDEDIGDVTLCLCAWLAPSYGQLKEPSPDPNDPMSLSKQIKDAFTRLTKRYVRVFDSDLGELSRAQAGPWGGPGFGF